MADYNSRSRGLNGKYEITGKEYEVSGSITHCDEGHEFTPANSYIFFNHNADVVRKCRACYYEEKLERNAKKQIHALQHIRYNKHDFYVPTLDEIREFSQTDDEALIKQVLRGEAAYYGYGSFSEPDNEIPGPSIEKGKIQEAAYLEQLKRANEYKAALRRTDAQLEERRQLRMWKRNQRKQKVIERVTRRMHARVPYCSLEKWQRWPVIFLGA